MTLGERLQELRKSRQFSQEQLAEQLGVSRQAISKWESGQATPDVNNIIKLSGIYKVTTDYLLMGKETGEPSPRVIEKEKLVYVEKPGFQKLNDLPDPFKIALAVILTAFGVLVVVPVVMILLLNLF